MLLQEEKPVPPLPEASESEEIIEISEDGILIDDPSGNEIWTLALIAICVMAVAWLWRRHKR